MRLVVIGGGPAGLIAALQARELHADVTLLESKRVGGTSINEGPAPVRTLARAARLARDVGSWETFGLHGERPQIDLVAALANAKRVAEYAHEKKHIAEYIASTGIDLVEEVGPVHFLDQHTVGAANGRTWQADKVIIAVGGHGRILPIPGSELALTYNDIWSLTQLPTSVAIVGGAATGCQLASILEDFGCQVYLLELAPRLIPREDEEISFALADAFNKQHMTVITGAQTERLEKLDGGIKLHYRRQEQLDSLDVGAVFFAAGWPGNIDALNLEAAGVLTKGSYIPVNDYLQSNVPHIFAVGDVNGQSMLVQSARYEGQIAAENAVIGPYRRYVHEIVPSGSFTDPEYASVGLTEAQARQQYDSVVAVVRYDDLLRPVADNHPEGFCKLIVERRHRHILGAHVIGEYSVEIIQMVAACMAGGMKVEQVAGLQLAYPTFTEAVGMAAQKLVRELGLGPLPQLWGDFTSIPASKALEAD
ncbi:MAG TPA: NAD(P)/FAD-dependent oxidoreductase [Ktedonobacteraceae bacterium]|nr:NAD(P)/FAD-dependent oxidoreductase [Ktedonobacteraceae bacterium]